jgi:hypothetical protein
MNGLIAVDQWLIARIFEPIAWWVERTTGANQFALARYTLTVLLAGDLIAHMIVPQRNGTSVSYIGLALMCIVLYAGISHSLMSEAKADQMRNNDHETVGGLWLRVVIAAFSIYLMFSSISSAKWHEDETYRITMICFMVGNAAYLAFLYFCACRMKPPEYDLVPKET